MNSIQKEMFESNIWKGLLLKKLPPNIRLIDSQATFGCRPTLNTSNIKTCLLTLLLNLLFLEGGGVCNGSSYNYCAFRVRLKCSVLRRSLCC